MTGLKKKHIPVSFRVKEDLRKKITGGKIKPGEFLPSEMVLSQQYGISRVSVRDALRELVTEGLIHKIPGKGNLVVDEKLRRSLEREYTSNEKSIALISGDIKSGFLPYLIDGIEEEISRSGYHLIFKQHKDNFEEAERIINSFRDAGIKGVIFIPISSDEGYEEKNRELIKLLQKEEVPFVLTDRYLKDSSEDFVVVDNRKGAYEVTSYLLNSGHRRIGVIRGLLCSSVEDRLAGYKEALEEKGVDFDPALIQGIGKEKVQNREEETKRVIKFLLSLKNPPTAIFALNDTQARDIMAVLLKEGIRIPQDISLVGFDDLPSSEFLSVPLTTVRQPFKEEGKKAAELIIKKIEEGISEQKQIFLEPSLIIRESSMKIENVVAEIALPKKCRGGD
ncbi:GntR family transcriptional regulator [Candidatus Calescamantes bacterium]|nr:GntR family transcriptional regulator [Candidatus Calescamantes bacterium]